jgi:thioredoxin-dependent peroxiredoxin
MAKKITKKVTKKTAKKTTKKVVKKASPKKAPSSLKIGDLAPDFTLIDQDGDRVSLKQFKGKNVLVYFYPRAMTPGCTTQACGLRDSQSQLEKNNIVVLGISADPVSKLKQFMEKEQLNFSLLSDPDHEVTSAYGCWGLKKFMGREFMGILRQSFLINAQGKIIHIISKVDTKTHHDEVLEIFTHQE